MSSAKRIELLVRNDVAKGHDKTLKRGVCVYIYIYIYTYIYIYIYIYI